MNNLFSYLILSGLVFSFLLFFGCVDDNNGNGGKINNTTIIPPDNSSLDNSSNISDQDPVSVQGVSIKTNKDSYDLNETIRIWAKSDKQIFATLPAFEIEQLVAGEWKQLNTFQSLCVMPCSGTFESLCAEESIVCEPLFEGCLEADSPETFEWDQKVYDYGTVDCNLNGERSCYFEKPVEPGTYKAVFSYSENCVDEFLFYTEENNVQKVEKTFTISDQLFSKEKLYNVVEMWCMECLGCGCDIGVTGYVFSDGSVELYDGIDSIIHSSYGISLECLGDYVDLTGERRQKMWPVDPDELIDYYLLTDSELGQLQQCVSELEEQDYCKTDTDCCPDAMDWDYCVHECIENRCEYYE